MKSPLIPFLLILLLGALARASDGEIDVAQGRSCGTKSAESACKEAINGIIADKSGKWANCSFSRSECKPATFLPSGDTVEESTPSEWHCWMKCKPGTSIQGDAFRLSAAQKLQKIIGTAEGWSASSCTYSKFRRGKTRKVIVSFAGDSLRLACGSGANPKPLLACNTAVDCVFNKSGAQLPSVSVRKINTFCPLATDGSQDCPSEDALAACVNGRDIQQFTGPVAAVPVDISTPIPVETKSVGGE